MVPGSRKLEVTAAKGTPSARAIRHRKAIVGALRPCSTSLSAARPTPASSAKRSSDQRRRVRSRRRFSPIARASSAVSSLSPGLSVAGSIAAPFQADPAAPARPTPVCFDSKSAREPPEKSRPCERRSALDSCTRNASALGDAARAPTAATRRFHGTTVKARAIRHRPRRRARPAAPPHRRRPRRRALLAGRVQLSRQGDRPREPDHPGLLRPDDPADERPGMARREESSSRRRSSRV